MKRIATNKTNNGFTLVETLVAIGLLVIAVTGTLTAVQSGLQNSTIAKDQVTAFWLAQEGMEFIKNKKDENALNALSDGGATNWLSGLSSTSGDPCYFGKVCKIDSQLKSITNTNCADAPVTSNPPNVCPVLNQDTATGLYGYTAGWPESKFKREIQFTDVSSGNEVLVTISISWSSRGTQKSFQVAESLFNR